MMLLPGQDHTFFLRDKWARRRSKEIKFEIEISKTDNSKVLKASLSINVNSSCYEFYVGRCSFNTCFLSYNRSSFWSYFYFNKINLPFPSWKLCTEETCIKWKFWKTNNLTLGNEERKTDFQSYYWPFDSPWARIWFRML